MTVMDLDSAGVAPQKRQKSSFQGPTAELQQKAYRDLQRSDDDGSDDAPRRQKASAGMSVIERLLMGKLTEADLQARGIQLSEHDLQLYRRIKHGVAVYGYHK